MIVDILMMIAIYLGVAWSIYMSLLFRREYTRVKEEALKKVDEVVEKAQESAGKIGYALISMAGVIGFAVMVALMLGSLHPDRLTSE